MAGLRDILIYTWNFAVFFVTNFIGLFAYVMWALVLLPMRFLWPDMYWKIEAFTFRALQSFVVLWMMSGKYGVIEAGDDISKIADQEAVLLANHQSTADAPLVMLAMWTKGMVSGNTMWIMDYMFRFTNFGIISSIRRDFFIRQGKDTRDLQATLLAEHLKTCFLSQGRKWIVVFPEGGFLRKRLEVSQSYARKNGYPVLQRVTLPRLGALKAIIDTIGAPVEDESDVSCVENLPNGTCGSNDPQHPLKWIVDMTIAYRNNEGAPPDMLGMCVGYREPQDMHVHYHVYPLASVPRNTDGMLKWLYSRYEEKEQLLEYFETHGHFPPSHSEGPEQKEPRRIVIDWLNILLYQLFFLASSYLHYTCIIRPLLDLF